MSTFVYDLFIFAQIKCGKNFHELKGLTFLNHHSVSSIIHSTAN